MSDNYRTMYSIWTVSVLAVFALIQLGIGAARAGLPLHLIYGLFGAGVAAAIMSATVVAHRLGELAASTYADHPGATDDWSPVTAADAVELNERRSLRLRREAQRRMGLLREQRMQLIRRRYPRGFSAASGGA